MQKTLFDIHALNANTHMLTISIYTDSVLEGPKRCAPN
jgi:hypothetical protein